MKYVVTLLLIIGSTGLVPGADKLEYNRDVRPILVDACFSCHGPDSAARKADLRLDRLEDAVKAKAIIPGKPAESEMIKRILSTKASEIMPPPKAHKVLTAAQKETLQKWIAQGAEYQAHWSFIPPAKVAAPKVSDEKWVRNEIDRFVLAQLDKQKLKPAPEADRRTLARRLSLDLIGLPPTAQEVEAFVNDKSDKWYENYVEKLMKSTQWGEHRGRYWLDAARFADTHGIHFDNYREMWVYRDWVIDAFNKNMKFDQFTIEQLAGDLLPNATLEQKIASGFNRCNITTSEGGAIDEEYLVLYARDRTETASQIWLGLTTGCAVCHDHKFDPISTKDFYSLSAFFNNGTQRAMDGNVRDTPPIIVVPKPEDRARYAVLDAELKASQEKVNARKAQARAQFEEWLRYVNAGDIRKKIPSQGLVFQAGLNEGQGNQVAGTINGQQKTAPIQAYFAWEEGLRGYKVYSLKDIAAKKDPMPKKEEGPSAIEFAEPGNFDLKQPFSVGMWFKTPTRGQTGALIARMNDSDTTFRGWDIYYDGGKVGAHIINNWPTDAIKVMTKNPSDPNKWQHVLMTYDGSGKAAGVKIYLDGELQVLDVSNDNLKSTTLTNVPLKIGQRHTTARMKSVAIEDVRIYNQTLNPNEAQNLAKANMIFALLETPKAKHPPKARDEAFSWWLVANDPEYQQMAGELNKLTAESNAIKSRSTIAHVMNEKPTPPEAYVLFRGDYDKRRDKVGANVPAVLPKLADEYPKNRLGLAKWLLEPNHPLTSRVTVNRFWQELFGNGIVRTSGDFGITGELPSHPELLDWLAIEFREKGWDVREFFKMMVMSSTYRQAAVITPEKNEKDPANKWLSRGPRFRMDAEMVRDYALAASGLLSTKIGGPSVKPYQPEGVWEAVAMIGSNTRDYRKDAGDALYRRSLYTFWKRAAPPAFLEVMNAPNRETCTVRRERTNTPLQALLTLNDVQYVEAARVLAEKTLLEGGATDETKLDFIANRLIARTFTAEEKKIVMPILGDLLKEYAAKPAEAKKLVSYGESKPNEKLDAKLVAAWTMMANQLMNLDEVLNK